MEEEKYRIYEFGDFRIDTVRKILLREGKPLQLPQKAFDTLQVLIENRGRVVEKSELISLVWPDSFVEEINLNVQISTLRKALGERPNDHQYIVTIPKRGFRFVAELTEISSHNTLQSEATDKDIALSENPIARNGGIPVGHADSIETSSQTQGRSTVNLIARPEILGNRILKLSAVVVMTAILTYFWGFILSSKSDKSIFSIAVLPFRLVNSDGEKSLEIGMADSLITKLHRLDTITVRPTSQILKYAGQDYDSIASGRELGVDAVLEGTVQQLQNNVRITARLIKVADGKTLWADSFHERLLNVFAVQDSISARVTQSLEMKLTPDQKRQIARRQTENFEAFQAYSIGLHHRKRASVEDIQKSIIHFQQAVDLDPGYAKAYAALAEAKTISWRPGYVREEAKNIYRVATKALEIDDRLPEAHIALGFLAEQIYRDRRTAEQHYLRALELDSNCASAYHKYGWFLAINQVNRAVEMMQRAVELDPLSFATNASLGQLLYLTGAYDKALDQCRTALSINADSTIDMMTMGLAYEQLGKQQQAIEILRKVAEIDKNHPPAIAALAHAYAVSGQRLEAIKMLETLKKEESSSSHTVLVFAGLGQKDQAFEVLKKIFKNKLPIYYRLRIDPRFEALRADQRFEEVTASIKAILRE